MSYINNYLIHFATSKNNNNLTKLFLYIIIGETKRNSNLNLNFTPCVLNYLFLITCNIIDTVIDFFSLFFENIIIELIKFYW